jgi:hypothetical protein
MVFVINGATKNACITGQAANALSQSGSVARPMIHHPVSFQLRHWRPNDW